MSILPLIAQQLTKEEEASAGGEDMEVRREDQEKINKFSSLHQKETSLEEELRAKIVSAILYHLLFSDLILLHLHNVTKTLFSSLQIVCKTRIVKFALSGSF